MSEEGNYSRRSGPRDRQLRVGMPKREAVADILRREHLAGRLDNDEFDERVARCLAAKTYAELDGLIGDLPADERDAPAAGTWGRGPGPCRFSSYRSWSRRSSSATARRLAPGPFFIWFVVRPIFWGGFGRRAFGWRTYSRRCRPYGRSV